MLNDSFTPLKKCGRINQTNPNEPNLYFFCLGILPKHLHLEKTFSSLFRPFKFMFIRHLRSQQRSGFDGDSVQGLKGFH